MVDPGLGQGDYKMSLEGFPLPESKKVPME